MVDATVAGSPSRPRARSTLLAALLVGFLALVAHRGHAQAFLNYDDDDYVVENSIVNGGLSGRALARAFTESSAANYHPLTWTSHMLDVELFGLDAAAHQRTSIALHVLNAMLLVVALAALSGRLLPSALAAVLFAVHPQHVESIHWISERKDVLAGAFWIAALLAWAAYARKPSVGRYAVVAVAYACGLASKPTTITLPCVLLLLDLWPLARLRTTSLGKLIVEKLPLLPLTAASVIATLLAQTAGKTTSTLDALPLGARVANAFVAYATYAWKVLVPSSLAVFYPHPSVVDPAAPAWSATSGAAALALTGAVACAWVLRRRAPAFGVGLAWYVVALVPMIGLVQVGEQARADRYTYLPLLGLYVALAFTACGPRASARRRTRERIVAVLGALAALALVPVTWRQAASWRDTETVFEHALEVTDSNYVAYNQLAHLALTSGRAEDALHLLERAAEIHVDAKNLANLAAVQNELGDWRTSLRNATRAVQLDPGNAIAHNNRGIALANLGRDADALAAFEASARADPRYVDAQLNRALLLDALERFDEATDAYRAVVALEPEHGEARRRLRALTRDD